MNEIIEMARQAWVDSGEGWVAYGWFSDRVNAFEAFAKLVAAKEREAVVDIAQSYCGRLVHEEEFQKEIRARGDV